MEFSFVNRKTTKSIALYVIIRKICLMLLPIDGFFLDAFIFTDASFESFEVEFSFSFGFNFGFRNEVDFFEELLLSDILDSELSFSSFLPFPPYKKSFSLADPNAQYTKRTILFHIMF